MTSPEAVEAQQRSSVKLVRNAKGDPQWEIKVVAGEVEATMEAARKLALAQHEALVRELGLFA